MKGLLIYNGKGNPEDWFKVFCVAPEYYFYCHEHRTKLRQTCLTEETKRHFNIGGPKCLIKW